MTCLCGRMTAVVERVPGFVCNASVTVCCLHTYVGYLYGCVRACVWLPLGLCVLWMPIWAILTDVCVYVCWPM